MIFSYPTYVVLVCTVFLMKHRYVNTFCARSRSANDVLYVPRDGFECTPLHPDPVHQQEAIRTARAEQSGKAARRGKYADRDEMVAGGRVLRSNQLPAQHSIATVPHRARTGSLGGAMTRKVRQRQAYHYFISDWFSIIC